MYKAYWGPLYELRRTSDNATAQIKVDPDTGFADAGVQAAFCPPSTKCYIEQIFDQSGRNNHLKKVVVPVPNQYGWPVNGPNAMREEISVGGHPVYSAYFEGGQDNVNNTNNAGTIGFRCNNKNGTAVGDEPETVFAVLGGRHYNGRCCFDYGNSEIRDDAANVHDSNGGGGQGLMEAISWSNQGAGNPPASDPRSKTIVNHPGVGKGPWIMADLESGVWGGDQNSVNPDNTPIDADFVTALVKGNSGNHWSIKGGDATRGELKVMFDGKRPPLYETMRKLGAIVLGIGGDNSDFGVGTFYEGAMTANYTTDATDAAVQANVVAAGYGK